MCKSIREIFSATFVLERDLSANILVINRFDLVPAYDLPGPVQDVMCAILYKTSWPCRYHIFGYVLRTHDQILALVWTLYGHAACHGRGKLEVNTFTYNTPSNFYITFIDTSSTKQQLMDFAGTQDPLWCALCTAEAGVVLD